MASLRTVILGTTITKPWMIVKGSTRYTGADALMRNHGYYKFSITQ